MATGSERSKQPCPNRCGRLITPQGMRSHVEFCSGGTMTVDTKEEYAARMLAEGRTRDEAAAALGMSVSAFYRKIENLRHKWEARTTKQLLVILAKNGVV